MSMSRCTGCCPTEMVVDDGVLTLVFDDCGEPSSVSVVLPLFGAEGCVIDRLEMGKEGPVTTDNEIMATLPKTPTIPGTTNSTVLKATAWLGKVSAALPTIFDVYLIPAATNTPALIHSYTIPATVWALNMATLEGHVITAGDSLGIRVTTGSDAVDLNVTVWMQLCVEQE